MAITLVEAARSAAERIAAFAEENDFAYQACQSNYGVCVEILAETDEDGSERWLREGDYSDDDEAEAVRLYDCDGERGEACYTVEEIEAEVARWCGLAERSDAN